LVATYDIPNRVYYLALKTLTEDQLVATVSHVLEYAALELLSLVALGFVLDWLMGFSTLRLLAFVLRKHALLAQSLLVLWVMMTTQLTLEHLGTSPGCSGCHLTDHGNEFNHIGNDYTFRLQWLRHQKPSEGSSGAT
jgi:hypothetical protein